MQESFYDNKPDSLEKKVRFGCGFLFGLVIGLLEFTRIFLFSSGSTLIVTVGIVAVVCGLLALKYGDRFWYYVLERLRGLIWWI
jgi:hypothetical protein